MSNLTRYFCESSEDQDGFPVASMKEHAEGEWVKFEDIKELLNTSTDKQSTPLSSKCIGCGAIINNVYCDDCRRKLAS
jgi:hypothetical protein